MLSLCYQYLEINNSVYWDAVNLILTMITLLDAVPSKNRLRTNYFSCEDTSPSLLYEKKRLIDKNVSLSLPIK